MIRKEQSEMVNGIPTGLLTGLIEGYDFTWDSKTGKKGVVYSDGKGTENGVCGKVFFTDEQITWLNPEKTEFNIKTDFNIKGKKFKIKNTEISDVV